MKHMPPKKRKLGKKASGHDMFQLLTGTAEKEKNKLRQEVLASLGVDEFFAEGNITINKRTCRGVECKLCVKACPTSALFWKAGEVGITKELCIYCGACVLSCIVDDCIKIVRKRADGTVERFSKPKGFAALQYGISGKKRFEIAKGVFPEPDNYLKRYKPKQ
jgi:ferredoxin